MKKLSLFQKTLCMMFSTFILITILVLLLFQFFSTTLIEKYNLQNFNRNKDIILDEITKKDLSTIDFLTLEKKYQLSITVFDIQTGELLYPEIVSYDDENINNDIYFGNSLDTKYSYQGELQLKNQEIGFSLSSTINFGAKEFSEIMSQISFYIVGIALFISLLIAYFYSRNLVKKIKSLTSRMEEMENFSYLPPSTMEQGDELVILGNRIDQLYINLLQEMQTIQTLETDRELFMRGAIHELKTPIMLMELQLQEILNTPISSQTECIIFGLNKRLETMSSLVNEVLKISHSKTQEILPTLSVLNTYLEVKDMYTYMLEDKGLSLDENFKNTYIVMSTHDLQTIISNLLGNAIKYSPANSNITVEITNTSLTIQNRILSSIDSNIDLLQPFVTLQDDENSHGLGLYISSLILQKHGGKLQYIVHDQIFSVSLLWKDA